MSEDIDSTIAALEKRVEAVADDLRREAVSGTATKAAELVGVAFECRRAIAEIRTFQARARVLLGGTDVAREVRLRVRPERLDKAAETDDRGIMPAALRPHLLVALYALGGKASSDDAIEKVRSTLGDTLTPYDLEEIDVGGGQKKPRWRVRLWTARQELTRRGLLGYGKTKHFWKLTPNGVTYLKAKGLVKE